MRTPRQYEKRHSALRNQRETWRPHWKELAEHFLPRRGRFERSEKTQAGSKKNDKIENEAGTRAAKITAAGLHSTLTPRTEPWFDLEMSDARLNEQPGVRAWLAEFAAVIRQVFARSNVYLGLGELDEDLVVFGTSAMIVDEDPHDYLRVEVQPIGSYCLATDERRRVSTIVRELSLTVEQVVERFGRLGADGKAVSTPEGAEGPSQQVVEQYNRGEWDAWVEVTHWIEPNQDHDPRSVEPRDLPYRSVWYEPGTSPERFLRVSGYHEFPVIAPRWSVTGSDVYGGSLGMDALPGVRQLQTMETRKLQIVAKIANPPVRASGTATGTYRVTQLPGDVTWEPSGAAGRTEPLYIPDARAVEVLNGEIARVEQRIAGSMLADVFLMISDMPTAQRTAREVEERSEEKIVQMGPTVGRMEDEVIERLIEIAAGVVHRAGLMPEPPPEVVGAEWKVVHISTLARKQRFLATAAAQQLIEFAAGIEGIRPGAFDTIDEDEAIRFFAGNAGAWPKLLRSKEDVAAMREERARQAQEQAMLAQAQAAKAGASAAKDLGATQVGGQSALELIAGMAA